MATAAAAAGTEFQAMQALPVPITPQVFLGGVFAPRETMPAVPEAASAAPPPSHAVALAGAAVPTLRRVS